MDSNFSKDFKTCPNCGSDQRFMEQLGQELKERKLADEKMQTFFSQVNGTLIDQRKIPVMVIGTTIPGYGIATDICMDCGTIYAVKLVRTEGKFMGVKSERVSGINLN